MFAILLYYGSQPVSNQSHILEEFSDQLPRQRVSARNHIGANLGGIPSDSLKCEQQ